MSIERAINAIRRKELAQRMSSASLPRNNSGGRTGRMAAAGSASGTEAAAGGSGGQASDYAGFVSSRVHSNWSIH